MRCLMHCKINFFRFVLLRSAMFFSNFMMGNWTAAKINSAMGKTRASMQMREEKCASRLNDTLCMRFALSLKIKWKSGEDVRSSLKIFCAFIYKLFILLTNIKCWVQLSNIYREYEEVNMSWLLARLPRSSFAWKYVLTTCSATINQSATRLLFGRDAKVHASLFVALCNAIAC